MRERLITSSELNPLVHALLQFVGQNKIDRARRRWRRSIDHSGIFTKHYYQKNSFYWWQALDDYSEWRQFADSELKVRRLKSNIVRLAKDAGILTRVAGTMPESVSREFRGRLAAFDNAEAAMVELSAAHQFLELGFAISWFEGTGSQMPEFVATKGTLEFEIECKLLSADAGRMISRLQFCQLCDVIAVALRKDQLMGTVNLVFSEKMKGTPQLYQQIVQDIRRISGPKNFGPVNFQWGQLRVELFANDCKPIVPQEIEKMERDRKSNNSHFLIDAEPKDGKYVNPITIRATCEVPDKVVETMRETISGASHQLSGRRPGIILYFLPEIRDFKLLNDDQSFKRFVESTMTGDSKSHISKILFTSHEHIAETENGFVFHREAIQCPNANCRFQEAKNFSYFEGA